jgi:hypothetical protein
MNSYRTKDNTNEFLDAFEEAIERGLEAIGMSAERHAKKDPNMPVDTGYARNSITYALSGEAPHIKSYKADKDGKTGEYSGTMDGKKGEFVAIGSNVEYFPPIEEGGKTMKARHVLRRAATEHTEEYKKLMEGSMKRA